MSMEKKRVWRRKQPNVDLKNKTKCNRFFIKSLLSGMSIKRTVSFRMIYLSWVNSLDIILWGKRLVLPTLVNERLAQIFFESGAYVSK